MKLPYSYILYSTSGIDNTMLASGELAIEINLLVSPLPRLNELCVEKIASYMSKYELDKLAVIAPSIVKENHAYLAGIANQVCYDCLQGYGSEEQFSPAVKIGHISCIEKIFDLNDPYVCLNICNSALYFHNVPCLIHFSKYKLPRGISLYNIGWDKIHLDKRIESFSIFKDLYEFIVAKQSVRNHRDFHPFSGREYEFAKSETLDSIHDDLIPKVFEYLIEKRDLALYDALIRQGRVDYLKKCTAAGIRFTGIDLNSAIWLKQLECLKYFISIGCEVLDTACALAVRDGNLEFLKLVHENGGELNIDTYREAIRSGNLDCLIYLHEHGCQGDTSAFYSHLLEKDRSYLCVQYAYASGCSIHRTDEEYHIRGKIITAEEINARYALGGKYKRRIDHLIRSPNVARNVKEIVLAAIAPGVILNSREEEAKWGLS